MAKKYFVLLIFLFCIPKIYSQDNTATHICLTMIVKNNAETIEACLKSVKDIVDAISICDLGSTDHTIERIEKFLNENKIPGKIHHHAWKNFEHNRTLSAQAAKRTLLDLKISLSNAYLLFLDGDMILEKKPTFTKNDLKKDSYSLLQKNDALYKIHLVRSHQPWIFNETNQDWSCQFLTPGEKLDTLVIHRLSYKK